MLIKLSFCSDFKHKVSRFGQDFKLMFRQGFESEVWSFFTVDARFNLGRDSKARFVRTNDIT